jgi:hypothetical protein
LNCFFKLNRWIHNSSSFLFPAGLTQLIAGPEGAKNPAGTSPPPDSDPFSYVEFGKDLVRLSSQFAASADSRFEFQKHGQLFIRTRNDTLAIVAMRVNNPERFPVAIHFRHTAPTPSGFAQIACSLTDY